MQPLLIIVAIAALVPICAGGAGMIFGPAMIPDVSTPVPDLDSHYRYLSGLLFGIGLGFWSCLPNLARNTMRFQLLGLIVVIGGLARLYSVAAVGLPSETMIAALVMELVVTPALCFLQWRSARPTL